MFSSPQRGREIILLLVEIAPYLYYGLLFGLVTNLLWFLLFKRWAAYEKFVINHRFTWVFWTHGLSTFLLMFAIQPSNLYSISVRMEEFFDKGLQSVGADSGAYSYYSTMDLMVLLKYGMQSVLAFILWDFGVPSVTKGMMMVAVNLHHAGLFIAMFLGPGWEITASKLDIGNREQEQVHLDTCIFGWMWGIHSFGFILKYVLPCVGIKLREGERSKLLDLIKHFYSLITVYFYYRYFNADSQPGIFCDYEGASNFKLPFGLSYQTISLGTMLLGRFGANGNVFNVDFLRRVEFPGFSVIFLDKLLFDDPFLQRAIVTVGMAYMVLLVYLVFVKVRITKPEKYYPPGRRSAIKSSNSTLHDVNEELLAFLEKESAKVVEESGKEVPSWLLSWMSSQTMTVKSDKGEEKTASWTELFPLHTAIVSNDKKKFELEASKIIETSVTKDEKNTTDRAGVAKNGTDSKEKGDSVEESHTKKRPLLSKEETTTDGGWCSPLDIKISAHGDTTPLHWAVSLESSFGNGRGIILYLLKQGCNPYLIDRNSGKDCIDRGHPVKKVSKMPKTFWLEFNSICLKKSPPMKAWEELSLIQRVQTVIQQF